MSTTALADTIARYTEAHEQMQRVLAGTDRIKSLRARALEAFRRQGFPTPRHEDWKYTNLAAVERGAFQPAAAVPNVVADELPLLPFATGEAIRLVFVNGRFAPYLSDLPEDERSHPGVTVASMAYAVDQHEDTLQYLGTIADIETSGLTALNSAFLKDGAVVTLEADAVLDRPLYLVFLTVAQPAAVLVQPRIFVAAGRHSRLQLVEHHVSLGEPTNFTNSVSEFLVGEGAQVTHTIRQASATTSSLVQSVNVRLDRDARFVSHNVQTGASLARTDINVKLAAPGASTSMQGVFFPSGTQHLDTHTRADHLAPNTHSDEDYRGILDGAGRGVFNGKVVVHQDAQGIEAHQSSRNLLLSDQAEIDTKPELEIYADDVVCSHGATVGQLDEQALFYLRSRGLDAAHARQVLTYAFARDLLEKIDLAPVREDAATTVLGRLGGTTTMDLTELS
ncbi:MAG: Fe-S cluster assembly protein SufD [Pseudomonadota bacterium]